MENFPKNNEAAPAVPAVPQPQNIGAGVLESMPSFGEHMSTHDEKANTKTFSELAPDERPEGVRDEQDYKEYLAEREAKREEYEKADHEIMEGIRQIKSPKDRDLATAMLAACYNKYRVDENGDRIAENLAGMEMMRTTIEYMNRDAGQRFDIKGDLSKEFSKIWKKHYDNGKAGMYSMSNAVVHLNERFNDLMDGQEIAGISSIPDGTRIAFKFPEGEMVSFGEVETIGSYTSGEEHKFVGSRRLDGERLSVLALADDIKGRYDEKIDANSKSEFYAKTVCLSKLHILREAFGYTYKNGSVSDGLRAAEKQAIHDIRANVIEKIQDSDITSWSDLESLEVPVYDSGAFRLAMIQSVKGSLHKYERLRQKYDKYLEKGREILDGEDWTEIDPIH